MDSGLALEAEPGYGFTSLTQLSVTLCMSLGHRYPASAWQGYITVQTTLYAKAGSMGGGETLLESVEHLRRYPVVNLSILELHQIIARHQKQTFVRLATALCPFELVQLL